MSAPMKQDSSASGEKTAEMPVPLEMVLQVASGYGLQLGTTPTESVFKLQLVRQEVNKAMKEATDLAEKAKATVSLAQARADWHQRYNEKVRQSLADGISVRKFVIH